MLFQSRDHRRTLSRRLIGAAMFGALVGLAAVYGIGGFKPNPTDQACQAAVETARRLAPLAHGEVAGINVADRPLRMPDLTFWNAARIEHRLSLWQGKSVLLNLWATWCIPCRKEMPALDALQAKLGGQNFDVVAVNIDTRDPDKPQAWLKEVGITHLAYYADPTAKVFQDLKSVGKAIGMPTTILVDPAGCELGSIAGPAE